MPEHEQRVLVAHESEVIREAIRHLCGVAGYRVAAVSGGQAALQALADAPDALVLDVALPEVHAYELVEQAKERAPKLRVVLVASIYNRTGYKRRPTSLYGADDYVEQHHIPDALLGKLERLLGPPPRSVKTEAPHADTAEGRLIKSAAEERLRSPQRTGVLDGEERARRLAWLIVSDIALYNGEALDVAEGHHGDEELQARLRVDLEEGRLLFDLRVPEEVRRTRDFVGEALTELRRQHRAAKGGS
jgi:CheY-like chemotaxis protein